MPDIAAAKMSISNLEGGGEPATINFSVFVPLSCAPVEILEVLEVSKVFPVATLPKIIPQSVI